MRAYRRLSVRLSKRDRKELRQLLRKGIQPVRTVLRALTLLQLDAGQGAAELASHVQLTSKAVREIGRRYEHGGIERANRPKSTSIGLVITAKTAARPPRLFQRSGTRRQQRL